MVLNFNAGRGVCAEALSGTKKIDRTSTTANADATIFALSIPNHPKFKMPVSLFWLEITIVATHYMIVLPAAPPSRIAIVGISLRCGTDQGNPHG
jgi:hypothetical protein